MTGSRLRVGVAGCGAIARRVHLPLLHARPDVELAAVADSDAEALAGTVVAYRGVRPYASLDAMLAEAELDAVVVALPTKHHAAAACATLEAGCHLYLEKPLATTLEDAARVLETWRRTGRVAVIGFNCRANPLHVRLRELILSNRAGPLVYVHTQFATAPRPMPDWKRHRASGGGALLDLGAHHIDLLRFLTGRGITRVRSMLESRRWEHDTVLLELELDGGPHAHGFFSLAGAETDRVEVHGEAARMAVSRFTSLDVDITDNPGTSGGAPARMLRTAMSLRHLPRFIRARRAPLREPGYAALLDHFVRGARAGAQPAGAPDFADGFACSAVIEAAERSLSTGRAEAPAAVPVPAQASAVRTTS